tara:strand:- start:221 stop:565 length:345 start_codon:yes stop_codon:yes gene_type:complete
MKSNRTLLIKILGGIIIIIVLKFLIIDKSEDYFWSFVLLTLALIVIFTPSHIYLKEKERREKTFSIMGIIGSIVYSFSIAALSYFTDIPRSYIFLGIILLVVIWAIFFSNDKDS